VLQVLYEIAAEQTNIYVGQQVDVSIECEPAKSDEPIEARPVVE
jgi:hypothetical protein